MTKVWIANSESGDVYVFATEDAMFKFIDKYIEDVNNLYPDQSYERSDFFWWDVQNVRY